MSVVFFHADTFINIALPADSLPEINLPSTTRRIFSGNFAVCIFFVMSGMVLVNRFYSSGLNRDLLTSGALYRWFRLAPMVLLSVLSSYFIWKYFGFYGLRANESIAVPNHWLIEAQPQPSAGGVLPVIWNGLIGVFFGDYRYNGVLWSISLEMWGALLLFGLYQLFFFCRRFHLICAIAIVAVPFLFPGYGAGTYLVLFIFGALHNRLGLPNGIFCYILFPLSLWLGSIYPYLPDGIIVCELLRRYTPFIPAEPDVFLHATGAVTLVYSIRGLPSILKILESKIAIFFGRISYGLYLFHLPILLSLGLKIYSDSQNKQLGAAYCIGITILISSIFSYISAAYIDEPLQRRLKTIFYKS